jgi:hypothetical protein
MGVYDGVVDRVKPIINYPPYLTKGQVYRILSIDGNTIYVRDDQDNIHAFDHLYFESA